METTSIGIKIKSVCACVLSRECLNLSCLPKPSWSCRRHVFVTWARMSKQHTRMFGLT